MKMILSALAMLSISGVMAQNWNANLDTAISQASEHSKKVLLFFSVPEGCDNCSRLEKNVFESAPFNDFADTNYILVKIDFTNQSGRQSEEIMRRNLLIVEKYNKDGFFPYVVILDKDARILGKTGVYKNETPEEFLSLLQSFNKI